MPARSRNLGIAASCCFRPISTAPPAPLVTLVPNQAEARYCVLTGATSGFFDDVHCRRQLHRRFTSRGKIRARLDRPRRREAASSSSTVQGGDGKQGTSTWFRRWRREGHQMVGVRCMPIPRKKYEPTDWRLTMEQIGRELGKIYRHPKRLPRRLRTALTQLERKVPARRGRQWQLTNAPNSPLSPAYSTDLGGGKHESQSMS